MIFIVLTPYPCSKSSDCCCQREEIFGDMFESEDELLRKKPLNVEWLMMDSNILLPPTGTPLTGIEFNKRLPCGEVSNPLVLLLHILIRLGYTSH
jgi:hypothetical protein